MAKAKAAAAEDQAATDDQKFDEQFSEEDDDNLVVDFSGVQDLKFDAIPGGWYKGTIISQEYKRSKSSNNPMCEIRLQIGEGPHENRTFYSYVSFSEKALPGSKALIAQLAPELLESPLNPKKAADDAVLVGLPVEFKLSVEMYEGRKTNRVGRIRPAADGGGNAFLGN